MPKLCQEPGCKAFARSSKSGTGMNDRCFKHGGGDRCQELGCSAAVQNSKSGTGMKDRCVKHGGGDRCQEPGCSASAVNSKSGTGLKDRCVKHGGGDRCQEPGCKFSAAHSQNGTGKKDRCINHGGGDRCQEPGCKFSAQSSKNGTGKKDRCINHGGGDRCQEPGCNNSALTSKSGTGMKDRCVKHGGGDRCQKPGCNTAVQNSKNGTGIKDHCKRHGGGHRCEECCFFLSEPSLATHYHPDNKNRGICTSFARNMVRKALEDDNENRAHYLMRYFGFKKNLVLRGENAFYHELVTRAPRLKEMRRALDTPVLTALLGKRKSMEDPRPDYFHLMEETNVALHGEWDETDDHEDDDSRLNTIAHQAGVGIDRVYVFRVCARIGTNDALCVRVVRKHGVVLYKITERGYSVLNEVAEYVQRCLEFMDRGLVPNGSQGRPGKVYFNKP